MVCSRCLRAAVFAATIFGGSVASTVGRATTGLNLHARIPGQEKIAAVAPASALMAEVLRVVQARGVGATE